MGLMALNRRMSTQQEQQPNHGRIEADNGWNASSLSKRNSPTCQRDVHSHGGKEARYLGPDLPEDIWCHIHSLLPMQDAARTACVSHSFLRS